MATANVDNINIAHDLAMGLDPSLLMGHVGLACDPWQQQVLRSTAPRLLILAGRQVGKSTVTSVLALHQALYEPESLVLIFAPALRQSGEFFLKVKKLHAALRQTPCTVARETATELAFSNGARVICNPGTEKSTRGYSSCTMLIIDEASRADPALFPSVSPMVTLDGRIILLTTPFGARGTFHTLWTEGGPEWERVKIRAADVPRRWPPDALARKRAEVGDWWYRQEYDLEFLSAEGQLFSYDLVMSAVRKDVPPLFPRAQEDDPWITSS